MTDPTLAEPEHEPTRRQWMGYWAMIVQQTQNAFNDKAAQFVLVALGGAVAFSVESVAGIMIALPFVLFAPLAGWLSDRFSKRDVMLGAAFCQVLILGWIALSVWRRDMAMALVGFFALAVQSAFFSPAKIGINKELVGSRHLGFAAGVQQMMAMLAILAGQIAAGFIYGQRYREAGGTPDVAWEAAFWPLLVLTGLSVPAVLMAWLVPRVPAHSAEPLSARLAIRHFTHLKDLWADAGLRRCSFGIAFFWGFAAFLNLWSVKVAKALTAGGEDFGPMSSRFMAAASLGMVAGFALASYLLRRRIELGWVPVAGVMMTLGVLVLAFLPAGGTSFYAGLAVVAFFSALFLAPLNAWIQDHYPPDQRGEMQAAVNLQDCLTGILAVVAIELMALAAAATGLAELTGYRLQLLPVALLCAVMTWFILRLLPAHFIRVVGIAVVRFFYRIRIVHADRVPPRGGALILPNHVTFADSFFLSAASPRPLRFVMDESFMERPLVRAFARVFDTVTIRRDQPREAIRVTIEALRAGHLVCLFPEGQLSRTGTLRELKRGFELIARKAGHPLIPVWVDGSWGSIFSFERGRYFRKRPYRLPHELTVAFGRPLDPATGLDELRTAMLRTGALAIGRRFLKPGWGMRLPKCRREPRAEPFLGIDASGRRRLWVNGHQIGQANALQRRQPILTLAEDPLVTRLGGLFVAFSELFRAPLQALPAGAAARHSAGQWVGGNRLREALESGEIPARGVFYDFSDRAIEPLEREGLLHRPCLALEGVVVAMSMADPPPGRDGEHQAGSRPGSPGLLLPGWFAMREADGSLRLAGPAAPPAGLRLPGGWEADEHGFLVPI